MTTYKIYIDGNTIKAENENTENVEFSGIDVSAILNSVNGVITDGGTVIIEEGRYTPESQVIFTKSVKIVTEGDVVFNWNKTSEDLFLFTGSELSTTNITGDVVIGTNTMTVESVGAAVAGDLLLICDDTIWNPITFPVWKTGEMHEISYTSGNTVTITDSTINVFTTAKNGSVKLIRPVTVLIDGITINGADKTADYRGIQLNYNKNSIIRNSNLHNNGLAAIEIDNSYNTTIQNNVIGNSIMAGYGYGVVGSDAVAYLTITNNHFFGCRHCVANGGDGVVGQPRDIFVQSNTFADSTGTGQCIDAHSIVESLYIYDNIIYSPIADYAVLSGAKITIVKGNTIYGGFGITTWGSTAGMKLNIIEDTFINTVNVFYNHINQDPIRDIIIDNNTVIGSQDFASLEAVTNSFSIRNNNISITTPTGKTALILKSNGASGIISGNIIHGANYDAIELYSVSYSEISNNKIFSFGAGAVNKDGIGMTNCTFNSIFGNILTSVANEYGIDEGNNSDYNNIFGNDLTQMPTVAKRIYVSGTHTKVWKNSGFLTEGDVLSSTFAIGSTGIKTITIPHGLAITPNVQDCSLTVVQNTPVDDWRYDLLKIVSTDSTNVKVKIDISKASINTGATARIALRI